MRTLLIRLGAMAVAAGVGLGWADLHAQTFPTKPIRIIVPSPAGSPPDINARRLADKVAPALGRPVIVENKPGAGGAIGMEAGAKSAPDGHTLVFCNFVMLTVNPSMYDRLAYDPVKDFTPVILPYRLPLLLVVHPTLPANSVPELIQLAKAKPGKLFYGSAGNGTPPHVFAELFKFMAGIDLAHVPYKGGPAVTAALVAGEVSMSLDAPSQVIPQVKAGKLRPLAVTGEKRLASLPDVPTFAEVGVPGIGVNWTAIVAPAGTPRDIVMRLNREFARALESPDIKAAFETAELTISAGSAEELARLIADEIPMWREVVKKAGITPG